jgi:S-formylglutathione hydrolase FrmB
VIDPRYAPLYERAVEVLGGDPRVISVEVGGSVGAGTADEWSDLDLQVVATAEGYDDLLATWQHWLATITPTVFARRPIAPMIIILPEGDQEYWVDHVVSTQTGANGEKWGTYTARDVVSVIDSRYRTIADASARAIGGLSMGGHGAMQLALNFPGVWSIVGAHSPSLRAEGDAPSYLGYGAEFAARDPFALIAAKTAVAQTITWWIDTGTFDPWRAQSQSISAELTSLGIANE